MPLPHVRTMDELIQLIDEIGLLPFFTCEIPGFSVMDITDSSVWWTDNPDRDPWQWRTLLASGRNVAYGKVFRGKAGFISLSCYADFANLRREGYDFDALYEDGKAPHSSMCIMRLFERNDSLPTYEIKRLSGIMEGFQGTLTRLQMQTYLTICGFTRRRNKRSEEYGWPISEFMPPERIYGDAAVRGGYCRHPKESLERLEKRLLPYAGTGISKLLLA